MDEFMSWYLPMAVQNGLNWNPDDPNHGYYYRQFYQALKNGEANTNIDPFDKRMHFSDIFKSQENPAYGFKGQEDVNIQRKYMMPDDRDNFLLSTEYAPWNYRR
jgi:hypothetical protein